ncbi:MAG: putative Ig domain-containing protein [Chitinophagaceae bacterium]|nr:putative Ig domain-containing protein [Chitinophagaceae bacterium]
MKIFLFLSFLCIASLLQAQDKIILADPEFITGNNDHWKDISFDDSKWKTIRPNILWEPQGYPDYNGYAWYRFHFRLPSSLKDNSFLKDSLRIFLAKIDDADETFLNGEKIGATGSMPEDKEGYIGAYNVTREYHVATASKFLRWDKENVLAVKVYDGGGGGGMYGGHPYIDMIDIIDAISLTLQHAVEKNEVSVIITNQLGININGNLHLQIKDRKNNRTILNKNISLVLSPLKSAYKNIEVPEGEMELSISFKEKNTGKIKSLVYVMPYILTPLPGDVPRINGAKIFGVRPGSPFLFKIPVTGKKPLLYHVDNLPAGLQVDAATGIITGTLSNRGEYKTQVTVTNNAGKAAREFTIIVGEHLSLTPPMGWNSWNCWGLSVSAEKVKSSAQALIDKGLADHGWSFMNIDDGWEAEKRSADSSIYANEKFPDMKDLGNWLHAKGLKFGIYSSPGTQTCGGYSGSYKNEVSDANTYSGWGIDYLKYDWCSYDEVYKKEGDTTLAAYMKPYRVMQQALKIQPRDINYSLCQYGMKDVWKWGNQVSGNSWRTTGDIEDTWESLSSIGFNQDKLFSYAAPGHWNDPDMLIVGQVGWGKPHPTRLTPDEQYTHISLWCLLSSPLLIGCDISKLDDFTLNLLSNDEVLAVNQDVLGKQARRIKRTATYQIWLKELEDGSKAIGIFNLGETYQTVSVNWHEFGISDNEKVRDLWRQKDLGFFKNNFISNVAPHGVKFIKIWK